MSEPTGRGGIDFPDFRIPSLPHKSRVEIGTDEVAVRLGAMQRFEVTGNYLWGESFHDGMGSWRASSTGEGIDPTLDPTHFIVNPYSVLLSGSAVAVGTSALDIRIHYPYQTVLGLEVSFLSRVEFNFLQIDLGYNDEDYLLAPRIYIDNANNRLQYQKDDGTMVTFADYNLRIASTSGWHTAKLVIDVPNQKYVRFLLDHQDYNLSDYDLLVAAVNWEQAIWSTFELNTAGSIAESVYIDNVIVTINEPK